MATISINEATVSKHVGENGAFQIEEIETVNGNQWTRRYTVWSKDVTPEIGTLVTVAGQLSTKAREYQANNGDTKVAVDVNINDPIWKQLTSAVEASSETPF
jgi:hypothetical protein